MPTSALCRSTERGLCPSPRYGCSRALPCRPSCLPPCACFVCLLGANAICSPGTRSAVRGYVVLFGETRPPLTLHSCIAMSRSDCLYMNRMSHLSSVYCRLCEGRHSFGFMPSDSAVWLSRFTSPPSGGRIPCPGYARAQHRVFPDSPLNA